MIGLNLDALRKMSTEDIERLYKDHPSTSIEMVLRRLKRKPTRKVSPKKEKPKKADKD